MMLLKRPNGGELQSTQNPSPTHWPTSLISRKLETILPQTQVGGHPGRYIGSVKNKLIQHYPAASSGLVYWAQSGHPSSCSLLRQGEKLGVPIYEEKLNKQNQGASQIGNWKDNEWPPK
jgi:hypothetical protein